MSNWKLVTIFVCGLVMGAGSISLWHVWKTDGKLLTPLSDKPLVEKELPYKKYTFDALAMRPYTPTKIEIGRVIKEHENFTSYMFYYTSEGKKISGQLNLPHLSRLMPAVVMARGYADKEGYTTGIGTRNAAAIYADHGYITLAPDFAGYGESDPENEDALGARLVKPLHMLDLLSSLSTLSQIDLSRVYLWGHSNGGQITLSVLEILGKKGGVPGMSVRSVTLWAPVSKPFPYSVLFYSDEPDDKGKWLRSQVAQFEKDYDVYDYSIDRYWDAIAVPIMLHQGSADSEVPVEWSNELATTLREKEKEITYHVYPGADHNMRPAWETVVARDLEFFAQHDTIEQ